MAQGRQGAASCKNPESPEAQVMQHYAKFVELYVNARLPAWYYRLSAAARLVALLKPEWDGKGTPPARPIAVGGIERRFCCGLLVDIHAQDFAEYLGPDQMAVGIKASAEKLTFGIRALLEKRSCGAVELCYWWIDRHLCYRAEHGRCEGGCRVGGTRAYR